MYEARNFKGRRRVFRRKSGDLQNGVPQHKVETVVPQDGSIPKSDLDVYQSLEAPFVAALQHNATEPQSHSQQSSSADKRERQMERAINSAIAAAKPTLRAASSQMNLVANDKRPKLTVKVPKNEPEAKTESEAKPKNEPKPESETKPKNEPKPETKTEHKSEHKHSSKTPTTHKSDKPFSTPSPTSTSSTRVTPSSSPNLQSTSPSSDIPRSNSKMKKVDEHFMSTAVKRSSRSIRAQRAREDLIRTSSARCDEYFQNQAIVETHRVLERLKVQNSHLTIFSPCFATAYHE